VAKCYTKSSGQGLESLSPPAFYHPIQPRSWLLFLVIRFNRFALAARAVAAMLKDDRSFLLIKKRPIVNLENLFDA
jgi:hypothetical protein